MFSKTIILAPPPPPPPFNQHEQIQGMKNNCMFGPSTISSHTSSSSLPKNQNEQIYTTRWYAKTTQVWTSTPLILREVIITHKDRITKVDKGVKLHLPNKLLVKEPARIEKRNNSTDNCGCYIVGFLVWQVHC